MASRAPLAFLGSPFLGLCCGSRDRQDKQLRYVDASDQPHCAVAVLDVIWLLMNADAENIESVFWLKSVLWAIACWLTRTHKQHHLVTHCHSSALH
ncbi:uncharacterized protein B0T15DRAFT_102989 [Chaetomium strumarium]|uniref:Uncharacterized protein n=1 Tax=Chaetomium strumarium TaxID=1170767 RepID=A0AAJ0M442_9PEZI|nr:hypothetical protein B0T15DRAFT_102989 [Chaetomium strumarium]